VNALKRRLSLSAETAFHMLVSRRVVSIQLNLFIVVYTIKHLGVASRMADSLTGGYARGKEYGLNKRLTAILLEISLMAKQKLMLLTF